MTEKELLEQFIDCKDQDAFRALVELHGSMVLGVCRSVLFDQRDVEDAFQCTFLILARSAGTIDQRDSIGPWLHRVALRVAKRSRFLANGRRQRERSYSELEGLPAAAANDHDPTLIPVLREEVNRLPESYRRPVVLCYLDGKTNAEAAALLRCPVGTVKGRLRRARVRLRNRLNRRGLAYLSGTKDTML